MKAKKYIQVYVTLCASKHRFESQHALKPVEIPPELMEYSIVLNHPEFKNNLPSINAKYHNLIANFVVDIIAKWCKDNGLEEIGEYDCDHIIGDLEDFGEE